MNTFNFTKARLLKLLNTTGKDEEFKDAGQNGLILRLTKNNKKIFRLKAWNRRKKKTEQIVIGSYPSITILVAREIVSDHITNIAKGKNITEMLRHERDGQTLDEVFKIWIETYSKEKIRRWEQDRSSYNLYLRPHLGGKKISDITTENIASWRLRILKQKKQRGDGNVSKSTVQRAVTVLSSIYSNSAKHVPNPCSELDHYKPKRRTQFLQTDHLIRFFNAVEHPATPSYLKDYLLISLYTGARKSNVLAMQWEHIDLNLKFWIIPDNETKNREPMVVPLLDQVVEVLQRRKECTASIYVFPTPRQSKTGHLVEPKKAWKSLLNRAELPETYWLHDLRRTMGSWQAITGTSTKIIGASLGHKSEQATAHYAHLTIEPIRAAMQRAADAMDSQKNVEIDVDV